MARPRRPTHTAQTSRHARWRESRLNFSRARHPKRAPRAAQWYPELTRPAGQQQQRRRTAAAPAGRCGRAKKNTPWFESAHVRLLLKAAALWRAGGGRRRHLLALCSRRCSRHSAAVVARARSRCVCATLLLGSSRARVRRRDVQAASGRARSEVPENASSLPVTRRCGVCVFFGSASPIRRRQKIGCVHCLRERVCVNCLAAAAA